MAKQPPNAPPSIAQPDPDPIVWVLWPIIRIFPGYSTIPWLALWLALEQLVDFPRTTWKARFCPIVPYLLPCYALHTLFFGLFKLGTNLKLLLTLWYT